MNAKRGRTLAYLGIALGLLTAKYPVGSWLGKVAKVNGLAQESLGDVNPVGGTAQLVCFGLRGVAVSVLWNEAIDLQKKERWFEMRPALSSITLLQPNFVSPWRFQGWNMAYNIAAAWESVADKFFWIGEGIKFMHEANATLKNVPDLQWYDGYIYYHKINIADEAKYLREMFRRCQDPKIVECSRNREVHDPYDNAFDWFEKANKVVLGDGVQRRPPKSMGMVAFMANQPRARIGYAEWMRREGRFGVGYGDAWSEAYEEWLKYGRAFNFARDPAKGEREQYMHRLEYEPAEFAAMNADTKYWIQHYGDIVRYWHTRQKTRAETTADMQDFRRLAFEAAAAHDDRQDVDAALAKATAAFPKLKAVIFNKEFPALREDSELIEDASDVQNLFLKLAPRSNLSILKPPLEEIFPPSSYQHLIDDGTPKTPAAPPANAPKPKVATPGGGG